jgi:hypothetical protein
MPDEKKPKERKKVAEPETKGRILAPAPETIAAPQTKSTKQPKLQKKNKSRLPRRQKKAHQKATATREV